MIRPLLEWIDFNLLLTQHPTPLAVVAIGCEPASLPQGNVSTTICEEKRRESKCSGKVISRSAVVSCSYR